MVQKMIFFYLKTGGGHISCAKSVAQYLCARHKKAVDIKLVDGLEKSPRISRFIFEDSYRLSQNYAKWMFEFTYAINKLPGVWQQTREMVTLMLRDYVEETIREEKPDKIVIFHSFFIRPVEDTLAELGLKTPVVIVITDPFTMPIMWLTSKRSRYVLFSERALKTATRHGVPKSNCKIFNYILNDKYSTRLSPKEVLKLKSMMGYRPDKKLILIIGGGDGIPKGLLILQNLLQKRLDADIAIVCGKNAQLRTLAEALAKRHHNLHVYGFVDFVYELVNMADVVITKGGPAMLLEILMLGKIPIINSYIWEQEKGNMEFVVRKGLGFYEPRVSRLGTLVKKVFEDPDIQKRFRSNLAASKLKNGTSDVAEYLYRIR